MDCKLSYFLLGNKTQKAGLLLDPVHELRDVLLHTVYCTSIRLTVLTLRLRLLPLV